MPGSKHRRFAAIAVALLLAGRCGTAAPIVPAPDDWSRIPESARTDLRAAVEHARAHPDDAPAFERLAWLYHGNVQKSLAARAYESALALGSRDPRTPYLLGALYEEQGRSDEAIAMYRKTIERYDAYAPAHFRLGRVLRDAGRLEAAIESHRRAVGLHETEASFHTGLGAALRQAGRLDEAERSLRRALELDADDVEAHQLLGRTLQASGREDEAREHLASSLGFRSHEVVADPWLLEVQGLASTTEIVLDRAEGYLADGRAAEAVDVLVELARENPLRPDVVRLLGRAHLLAGQPQRSIDAYLQATRLEPEDADTHAVLARTLLQHGQVDGAEHECGLALAIDARHDAAATVCAGVLLVRERPEEARDAIRSVLARRPDSLAAHLVHGEALEQLGDHSGAAAAFRRAAELQPEEGYIRERLAAAERRQ